MKNIFGFCKKETKRVIKTKSYEESLVDSVMGLISDMKNKGRVGDMKKLKELIKHAKSELSHIQQSECAEYDNVCAAYSALGDAMDEICRIEAQQKKNAVTADKFNYCVGELTAKRFPLSKSTSKQITDYLTGAR